MPCCACGGQRITLCDIRPLSYLCVISRDQSNTGRRMPLSTRLSDPPPSVFNHVRSPLHKLRFPSDDDIKRVLLLMVLLDHCSTLLVLGACWFPCWPWLTHSSVPLVIYSSHETDTFLALVMKTLFVFCVSHFIHGGSLVVTSCFCLYCLEMSWSLHLFLKDGFAIWRILDWYLFTFGVKCMPQALVLIWVADGRWGAFAFVDVLVFSP